MKKFVLIVLFLSLGSAFLLSVFINNQKSRFQVKSISGINLLTNPLSFSGNKSVTRKDINLDGIRVKDINAVRIEYNLNGLCLLKGDAAAIVFDHGKTKSQIQLADFLQNCSRGIQEAVIPIDKIPGFEPGSRLNKISISFWYPTEFRVEIASIILFSLDQKVLGVIDFPDASTGEKKVLIAPLRPFPYAQKSID